MKKRIFTLFVIVLITVFLLILNQFDLLEKSAKFMFVPLLSLYLIGQYSERTFTDNPK